MARTYRKDYKTGSAERDGYWHGVSIQCTHNNACPWCVRNRTINNERRETSAQEELEMWELEVDGGEGLYVGSRESMENLRDCFVAQGFTCRPLKEIAVDSFDDIVW